jgi:hypothetical protein
MATYEQVMDALRQADAAGNTEDAQRLAAIAIELRPEDRASAIPVGDYRVEALRKGPAGAAGTIAGLGALVGESSAGRGLPELFDALRQPGAIAPARTPGQVFSEAQQPVYREIMGRLGTTGAEPQSGGQRIIAGGLQAVTDPTSYLFPPLAGVRRMGVLGQIVARPAEQAVVGSGAEAGGIAGEAAGGGTGRFIGGLLGGATTGVAAGRVASTAAMGGKAYDLAKNQWAKVKGTDPEDVLLKDVDSRISNIFIAAGAADPNFMKTLTDAASAQKGVSLKAPGGAEVQLPMSALLADNPVINNFIQNLSARDPVFRAQYGAQYEAAKAALTQNQIRLFGDPTKVTVTAAGPDLAKVQARRVRSLDEQIADAYRDQTIDPNVFGQRVSNLVEKKEKAAYAEVKPLYTEAFDIAKTKNVELPSASVDDIYNFVASERASDVFKTFPSIYNRVQSRFRPTAVEPSAILTAEGQPMTPGGVQFSAATIEDLDSLKREINRQLGKTDVPTEIRLLSELKQRVGGHIDSLDPDFVIAYRNADKAYLQKVGLPFDAATLKLVDRKKFVEQIAPAIIGNKSNVSEFITATGPEGIQLARSAFLDSFTKAALKGDALDPKAADKWLKKNEGGVSLVPGLRDELQAATTDVQKLLAERTRLNADFQRVAGEQILSKEGVSSPQELVNKMYGDIKFTNKFMGENKLFGKSGYSADKDSVNAVRAFMLDDLVNSSDPIAMLADRNKAAVFNRVFGPTYAQKVQDFVTVSDRLTRDLTNVSFKGETVPKTPIEQLTGVPPEQILSRIYNPVSGATYAITSLFSKFWAKKASEATEARLKELLLNPSDAVKVFQAVQPNIAAFDPKKLQDAVEIGRKYGIQWVADAAQDLTSGAGRGAVQQAQPQE